MSEPRFNPVLGITTFWCDDTAQWGDLATTNAMGGREWAAVRVAEQLAKLGFETEIVCPREGYTTKNGVAYSPVPSSPTERKFDLLVAVTNPQVLPSLTAKRKYAWVQTGLPNVRPWQRQVERIIVNSPKKAAFLQQVNPTLDMAKIAAIPNGCDVAEYDAIEPVDHEPRLIWSSSPDRGLHHLLRWWPRLKRVVPDLTLELFYNPNAFLDGMRWQHEVRAEWARTIVEGSRQDGIIVQGPLPRRYLMMAQKSASVWVYPGHILSPGETGCLQVLEYGACRVPMILGDDISLTELYQGCGTFLNSPIDDDLWITMILLALRHPERFTKYTAKARELADTWSWTNLAKAWASILAPQGAEVTRAA